MLTRKLSAISYQPSAFSCETWEFSFNGFTAGYRGLGLGLRLGSHRVYRDPQFPGLAKAARPGAPGIEHLQMRVAPSVAHIPWVTLKFLLTDVLFGKGKMTRARWNNVLAPVLLPLVSAPLGPMTYCMITVTKR
jgi:hypothetical protein